MLPAGLPGTIGLDSLTATAEFRSALTTLGGIASVQFTSSGPSTTRFRWRKSVHELGASVVPPSSSSDHITGGSAGLRCTVTFGKPKSPCKRQVWSGAKVES